MKDEDFDIAIIDASFALAFLLPDESIKSGRVDRVFERFSKGEVILKTSPIFYLEVLNAIRSAIIRRRISSKLGKNLVKNFLAFDFEIIEIENFEELFQFAIKRNLSAYDASYLYLAHKLKVPLLSLDRRLYLVS